MISEKTFFLMYVLGVVLALQIAALICGINGVILKASFTIIGGIAGYGLKIDINSKPSKP